jgi:hypothetical protein
VQAIRDAKLPLTKFIRDDFQAFNPAFPDPPESFRLPASGMHNREPPRGN